MPTQSHEYTNFDSAAMEAFKARVIDAIGEGSKAVEMEIVDQEVTHLPKLVDNMIEKNDDDFASASYDIAQKLADAQRFKNIPGGIVVVFRGTQGPRSKKFLGIIKAETYSGYQKEVDAITNEISLKFVEEVLLTPSNRLYKTATFFQKPSGISDGSNLNVKWTVMISDSQISKADGKAAAQYFYQDFLGCGYPNTSARITKKFHEETSKFILEIEVSEEDKNDYLNALTSYLKMDTSSTISSTEFAHQYFDDVDLQDSFTSYMKSAGLPAAAFTKDIEHIKSKLQYRNIRFRGDVKITAPSQAFKDLIVVETIDGNPDETGTPAKWTKVTIKERIIEQG